MAATYAPALIRIGDIVEAFMLKYRVPQNDFTNMLLFAFDCLRDNMGHTSRLYNVAEETADANGTIDMPDDMVDFIGLAPAGEVKLWFTTKRSDINETAVSASRDINDDYESLGYGGRGGINAYNHKIDWNQRKIYTDGLEATDVILYYISTGIRTDEETLVETIMNPVIDAYLYWRLGELNAAAINELERRERSYEKAIRLASMYKMPPLRDIWDAMLSVTSLAIKR